MQMNTNNYKQINADNNHNLMIITMIMLMMIIIMYTTNVNDTNTL